MTNKRDTPPAETGRCPTCDSDWKNKRLKVSGVPGKKWCADTWHNEPAETGRTIKCGMCGDTKQQNGFPCPQCANEPAETKAGPLCKHECGIEQAHTICKCVICGASYPNPEPAAPVSPPTDADSKRIWATNICKELAIPENDQVLKVLVWALNTWLNGRAGETQPVSASTSETKEEFLDRWPEHDKGWTHRAMKAYAAAQSLSAQTPPNEQLVIDLARELYDRFVMGGWEPQDAYGQIREMLRNVCVCNCHTRGFLACPYCEHKLGEPRDKQ